MSDTTRQLVERLAELRESFERSFAAPPAPRSAAELRLLLVRVGEARYALRLSEIAGIHPCSCIAPLPAPVPGLVGIAGIRGSIVSVHALGDLLDDPRAAARPRWLLAARAEEHVAFGVSEIEAHIQVRDEELIPVHGEGETSARETLAHEDKIYAVLDLPSLVAAVVRRAEAASRGMDDR